MIRERNLLGQIRTGEIIDIGLKRDGEWLDGEFLHLTGGSDQASELLPDDGSYNPAYYRLTLRSYEEPPDESTTVGETSSTLVAAAEYETNPPVEHILGLRDADTGDDLGAFIFESGLGEHVPPWVRDDWTEYYLQITMQYDEETTLDETDLSPKDIEIRR